jgi:hypothetical protein
MNEVNERTANLSGGKMKRYLVAVAVTVAMLGIVPAQLEAADNQKYPDVVAAQAQARGGNHFDFEVTISSPYDTPQRYADAFQVMSVQGASYGVRKLLHDHEDEQPFTRELYGVIIPAGVRVVVIQARDQKNGYGGKTVQVELPGR